MTLPRRHDPSAPAPVEQLQLFDAALDAIIAIDTSGQVTAWNRSAEQTFGYSKAEALGRHLADLVIPSRLRKAHNDGLERYLRTGEGPILNRRIEISALHRDGHEFQVELAVVPVPGDGSEVFFAFVRDLSERSKAQEAQRLQREAEQQFRLLIEGVTDYAIYMLDPDGFVTSWNSGAERTKGYTAGEVIGKHFSQFHTEESRRAGEPAKMLEIASRQGHFETESWHVRKDGSTFLGHVAVDAIRNDSGELVGFAKMTRDITERQRAREAEHASEAKTQFLASMSHEIRTPLNGILGYTERLMDEDLTPDQRRYAERIEFAGSSLLTIIDDILDLSQIEAGRVELDVQPFSLEALIDNTVSIVAGAAETKGLSVRIELDTDLPKVLMGDEARIRQVLLNLLNNAVKFTQRGQITLAVQRVGQSHEGEILRFGVTDTGIGIPPEKHDRLFRRFSQVDRTTRREFGGSGLGLAISKRLIELMGGQIGMESEHGRGSTFWIRIALPLAKRGDLAHSEETVPEPVASARILLAEDLDFNQELAQAILERAGHRVDIVANGADAVAAARSGRYDMVLMDIQMPVMDGITATKEIRALDTPGREVPIIAMTANVLPQQVRSFKEAGMNDHIGKPMKRKDLLRKVNEWLPTSGLSNDAAEHSPDTARPCFDQRAFEELRSLIGGDRIAVWLSRLVEQLETTFSEANSDSLDRERLGRSAHAIVSQAGSLGCFELADRCRELDEACTGGEDIAMPFEKARGAARRAGEMLKGLAEPPSH